MDLSDTVFFFEGNIARVRNLLEIYSIVLERGWRKENVETTDILRSATVFLHATLEEFLRGIALWKWPSSTEVLEKVPLVGQGKDAKKFLLNELAHHNEKTVQQLIDESVKVYVNNYINFNRIEDIENFLRGVDVEIKQVDQRFPDLSGLMKRRHNIAHQADRNEDTGGGHWTQPIELSDVENWINAVEQFVSSVIQELNVGPISQRLF